MVSSNGEGAPLSTIPLRVEGEQLPRASPKRSGAVERCYSNAPWLKNLVARAADCEFPETWLGARISTLNKRVQVHSRCASQYTRLGWPTRQSRHNDAVDRRGQGIL